MDLQPCGLVRQDEMTHARDEVRVSVGERIGIGMGLGFGLG